MTTSLFLHAISYYYTDCYFSTIIEQQRTTWHSNIPRAQNNKSTNWWALLELHQHAVLGTPSEHLAVRQKCPLLFLLLPLLVLLCSPPLFQFILFQEVEEQ